MENKKQLPAVLKMRAERILQKAIKSIYKTANASIAECTLMDNSVVYVDLDNRKRVSIMNVNPEQAGEEDTKHLVGKSPVTTAPGYVSSTNDDLDLEAPKEQPKKRQTKKTK